MKAIYIGRKFYLESGTSMSSIYEITDDGGYIRTDWGFVQAALDRGESVEIRPSTLAEFGHFQKLLDIMKQARRERKLKEAAADRGTR